jgi:hypothetical protein
MSTFTTSIAASSDDAAEDSGVMDLTANIATMQDAADYIGLRFTGVTIPPGSTVNTATTDVNVPSATLDSPDLTIYAEDTDDAATFTGSANNISGRTATTATASWAAIDIGTGVKTSPNFAAVIQEIIDRPGWASGNDIALIFKGNSAACDFRISTWDGTNPEAVLNVDYTAGGAAAAQPKTARARLLTKVGGTLTS